MTQQSSEGLNESYPPTHGTITTGASSFHPGCDFTPPFNVSSLELSPSPDNSQTVLSIDPSLIEEEEAIVSSLIC